MYVGLSYEKANEECAGWYKQKQSRVRAERVTVDMAHTDRVHVDDTTQSVDSETVRCIVVATGDGSRDPIFSGHFNNCFTYLKHAAAPGWKL